MTRTVTVKAIGNGKVNIITNGNLQVATATQPVTTVYYNQDVWSRDAIPDPGESFINYCTEGTTDCSTVANISGIYNDTGINDSVTKVYTFTTNTVPPPPVPVPTDWSTIALQLGLALGALYAIKKIVEAKR